MTLSERSGGDGGASVIVSRVHELEAIDTLISNARSRAVALVLEGEAGMGKTTLWRAGIELARSGGLQVLACSPGSSETRLSFSALADLLVDRLEEVAEELPKPQRRALEAPPSASRTRPPSGPRSSR